MIKQSILVTLLLLFISDIECLETLPQDVLLNEIIAKVSNQAEDPYQAESMIKSFAGINKSYRQMIYTNAITLINFIAERFDVNALLAALYLNTEQSHSWFDAQLKKLNSEDRSKKLNQLLLEHMKFAKNNNAFKAITKILTSKGAHLSPIKELSIDNATYTFKHEEGFLEVIKKTDSKEEILDSASANPRTMGRIDNGTFGIGAIQSSLVNLLPQALILYVVDIQEAAINDSQTYYYQLTDRASVQEPIYIGATDDDKYRVMVTAPMIKKDDSFFIDYNNVPYYTIFLITKDGTLLEKFDIKTK